MKPKRKRNKLGRPVGSGSGSGVTVDSGAGKTSLFTNVALRQPGLSFGGPREPVVEDDDDGGGGQEDGPARSEPQEATSTSDRHDVDHEDEEMTTGLIPLPQPDRPKLSNLLSTTPLPSMTLPPPPTLPTGPSKHPKDPSSSTSSSSTHPNPNPNAATTSPASSFAQMRKNIMRNLMFKGDPKVPFANTNSPPIGSRAGTPDKGSTGAREGKRGRSRDVDKVRVGLGSGRNKGEVELRGRGSETGEAAEEDEERARSGSPMDVGADEVGEPGIGVEGDPNVDSPLRHTLQRQQDQRRSLSGWEEGRVISTTGYTDWTPTPSETDPLELIADRGVPDPPAGQYQQTLRPEPPRKRGQGKKKLLAQAQAQELAAKVGQEGSVGVGSMTPERGGVEVEGLLADGVDGVPVKKKRRMQKPAEEGVSGTGTW